MHRQRRVLVANLIGERVLPLRYKYLIISADNNRLIDPNYFYLSAKKEANRSPSFSMVDPTQVVLSNFLAHCSESEKIDGCVNSKLTCGSLNLSRGFNLSTTRRDLAVVSTWTWAAWGWTSGCCFAARNSTGPTTMA